MFPQREALPAQKSCVVKSATRPTDNLLDADGPQRFPFFVFFCPGPAQSGEFVTTSHNPALLAQDASIAMKIRMVAIDLDGTLLNSSKEITDATASILRTARRQTGVQVVLATARPPRSVMPFYDLLDLDTPMINYNGALILDPVADRVVMHRPIPAKVCREIIQTARGVYDHVLVSAEVMDRWLTDRFDPAYNTETGRLFEPDVVAPVEQWADQSMTKLLLLGRPERLGEVAEAVGQRFGREVAMVQTERHMIQIMHASVNKAQALNVVAAEMGLESDAVMAIGDNANDVGMLRWAGIAVAMANASPEAIAAADHLADHHDADGAAHAIRQLILEGLDPNRGEGNRQPAAGSREPGNPGTPIS